MNREVIFLCGSIGTILVMLFFYIFYLFRDVLLTVLCLIVALIFTGVIIGIVVFWDYVSEKYIEKMKKMSEKKLENVYILIIKFAALFLGFCIGFLCVNIIIFLNSVVSVTLFIVAIVALLSLIYIKIKHLSEEGEKNEYE